MFGGAISFGEKLFWFMIWVGVGMLLLYAILGFAENKGGSSFLGRGAQWLNDHLRPQAS